MVKSREPGLIFQKEVKSASPLKLSDRALKEASKRLSVLGSRERPPLKEGSPSESEDDAPLKSSSSKIGLDKQASRNLGNKKVVLTKTKLQTLPGGIYLKIDPLRF